MTDTVLGRRPLRLPRLSFDTLQLTLLIYVSIALLPRLYAAFSSTSIGLKADAVQMGVELAFGALVYLSTRAARRCDALLFPYGGGKFEALANGVLALSLSMSGIGIIAASTYRILNPMPTEGASLGLILMGISFVVVGIVYILSAPLEREGSSVVKVFRRALLIDLVGKTVIAGCIIASKLGGVFIYLDAIAAIFVGLSLLALSARTMVSTVWELSDRAIEESAQLLIMRGLADTYDDFDDFIDVRTRRVGGRPIVEVALGFSDSHRWSDVVARCERIRASIASSLHGAVVVVIPTTRSLYGAVH